MIHMIAFESRLANILTFEHSEFLSEINEVGGTNKAVIKIVAFEDVINVERLYLIDWDWEIFQSDIRCWTCGERFRTDSEWKHYDAKEQQ